MGNIGSHVDLTSRCRGHQAKPPSAVAFAQCSARSGTCQGRASLLFAGAKRISRQLWVSCRSCRRWSSHGTIFQAPTRPHPPIAPSGKLHRVLIELSQTAPLRTPRRFASILLTGSL